MRGHECNGVGTPDAGDMLRRDCVGVTTTDAGADCTWSQGPDDAGVTCPGKGCAVPM